MGEFQRIRQRQHASSLGKHTLGFGDQIRLERVRRILPIRDIGIRTSRQNPCDQREQSQSYVHPACLRSAHAPFRAVLHACDDLAIDEIGNRIAPTINRGVHGTEHRMPGSVHQRV